MNTSVKMKQIIEQRSCKHRAKQSQWDVCWNTGTETKVTYLRVPILIYLILVLIQQCLLQRHVPVLAKYM